jgi:hypothetical protein
MRLPIADDIVEWDLLLQVIYAALAAGVAVTIAVSFAILGFTRAADARRDGDVLDTVFYGALFVLGLAACAAAMVLGIVVMTSKD